MPDLTHEASYAPHIVCGVDEAGRGPWAGDVVAAAVILPRDIILPTALNDSKKVTKKNRVVLLEWVKAHAQIGIGTASVAEIDALNILNATHLAMQRAIAALPNAPDVALIDGNRAPKLNCITQTIIGGDGISASIAAASIIAKVTRDRMMEMLDIHHPQYGFARHAGYGTAAHMAALKAHGACPAHRVSFAPIRALLTKDAA